MEKPIFRLFLCIVLSFSFLLGGCAERKDEILSTSGSEATDEQEVKIDPAASAVTPSEGLYKDVLNKYYRALSNPGDMSAFVQKDGLSELILETSDLERVGYCLKDLDRDGQEELYIADTSEDNNTIYAMYKKNMNGTGEVFTSSFRSKWYLFFTDEANPTNVAGNLILGNRESMRSGDTVIGLYEFAKGNYEMISGMGTAKDGWYDIATGKSADANAVLSYMDYCTAGFNKPQGLTPFSEFDFDESYLDESKPDMFVPDELLEALEGASEEDIAIIWINPSESLITYLGSVEKIEPSDDMIAVMSLMDNATVSFAPDTDVKTESYCSKTLSNRRGYTVIANVDRTESESPLFIVERIPIQYSRNTKNGYHMIEKGNEGVIYMKIE